MRQAADGSYEYKVQWKGSYNGSSWVKEKDLTYTALTEARLLPAPAYHRCSHYYKNQKVHPHVCWEDPTIKSQMMRKKACKLAVERETVAGGGRGLRRSPRMKNSDADERDASSTDQTANISASETESSCLNEEGQDGLLHI